MHPQYVKMTCKIKLIVPKKGKTKTFPFYFCQNLNFKFSLYFELYCKSISENRLQLSVIKKSCSLTKIRRERVHSI